MIIQFMVLGIYSRFDEDTNEVVFDLIVSGEVKKTCKRLATAVIELAGEIDSFVQGE